VKNTDLNKKLIKIFNENSNDDRILELVADLWLENDTTPQQDDTIERIKRAAHLGELNSIHKYLLK